MRLLNQTFVLFTTHVHHMNVRRPHSPHYSMRERLKTFFFIILVLCAVDDDAVMMWCFWRRQQEMNSRCVKGGPCRVARCHRVAVIICIPPLCTIPPTPHIWTLFVVSFVEMRVVDFARSKTRVVKDGEPVALTNSRSFLCFGCVALPGREQLNGWGNDRGVQGGSWLGTVSSESRLVA